MPFGQKAADYKAQRGSEDEVWIKNLRDGETRLRLLDRPSEMITYREHYEEGVGYYPCSEEKDCVGCNSTSEKVRGRQRRYAFHCIDAQGRLQVYKMGSKLQESMERKENRLKDQDPPEDILDRDYTFIRTGKGLGTTYEAEAGKMYPLENVPSTRYDIPVMLEDKYAAAVALYEGNDPPAPRTAVLPSDEDAPEASPLHGGKDGGDEAQATPPPAKAESNGHTEITEDSVALMPTPQLRELVLNRARKEFPQRAPRSTIVSWAQQWVRDGMPGF